MNTRNHYTTRCGRFTGQATIYFGENAKAPQKKPVNRASVMVAVLCAMVVFSIIVVAICNAEAEDSICWILCKPGAQVNVRRTPGKNGQVIGFLEVGDEIRTDGTSRNGYIKVFGIGEEPEAWVYCGFVATEKPEKAFENYVCVARSRVACRRWISGPRVSGRAGWLYNGTVIQVFYIAGDWAVTSRGYIMSSWLEVQPA